MDPQQLRATRLWLARQFTSNGVAVTEEARERLAAVVQGVEDPEEFVHAAIDELLAGAGGGGGAGAEIARRRQTRPGGAVCGAVGF